VDVQVVPCRCFVPGVCAALCLFAWPSPARGDTLRIISTPPGAAVEINGVAAGVTPYEKELPGGYFHKTKTPFGARLEHPLTVRVSLAGYAPQLVPITEGPMNWMDVHGRNRGAYYLVKTNEFHVALEAASEGSGVGATETTGREAHGSPELPGVVLASSRSAGREDEGAGTVAFAPEGYGTVLITSDPDGAEIFVDQKFVGNAAAKLRLAAGDHRIVLKCVGCMAWRRDIQVLKGSQVNLNADLKGE
jgi:PEGA domain